MATMSETYYDADTGEEIGERELYERYDDSIDGIYGEPMGYPASRILKEVDPIAYRVGFSDWVSNQLEEGTITEDAPDEEN
jgi:hypothetical protein